jgi:hypothetical protein
MKHTVPKIERELLMAKKLWPTAIHRREAKHLQHLINQYGFSLAAGDLLLLNGRWYVTHAGLLSLAYQKRCCGLHTELVREFCEPGCSRWAFKAIIYKSRTCKGFVGFGDAEPSNVSPLVRGAEMRIAETRAVNRALRKAYGIGICSVEELGSLAPSTQPELKVRKLPPQPANGNGQPKLRDQLCLLIRQHHLDAIQVKQYAAEFCETKDIRDASREQIQSFITHLADSAVKDRDGLVCKLNSYASKQQEGAA